MKNLGKNQYERMISAIDEWFGKIFEKVNFEETLVVLTADHGSDAGIYIPEIELDRNYVRQKQMKYSFNIGGKVLSKCQKFYHH